MKVTAQLNNLRISPRKVRLVAYSMRGLGVAEAAIHLEQQLKRSARPLLKLLGSAVANAKNNFSLTEESLRVADVRVGEGSKLKRWLPRAQGRATPLWHRMSRITLTLEAPEQEKIARSRFSRSGRQKPVTAPKAAVQSTTA